MASWAQSADMGVIKAVTDCFSHLNVFFSSADLPQDPLKETISIKKRRIFYQSQHKIRGCV